jgi:hypothetical protein
MLPTQRALWQLQSTLPDRAALNLAFGLLLEGPFDCRAMAFVFQELVKRHEPLRTAYFGQIDRPVEAVVSDVPVTLEYEDLSASAGHRRVRRLLDCFRETSRCHIDAPPLLRARCLLLEPDEHLLLLVFHHLAVDAWGLELFCREAEQLYAARLARAASPLATLRVGQLDAIAHEWQIWRRGSQAQAEVEQRRLEFAKLNPHGVRPFGTAVRSTAALRRRVLAVPQSVLNTWQASNAKAGLTLFPAIVSAVAVALCRQFDLEEVILATLIANRHGTAAQQILGAHYGATALRIFAGGSTTVTNVMDHVVDRLLASMSNRLDIETVAELLGQCAGASGPLVPSCMVVMDRHPMNRLLLEDVMVTPISTLAVPADQMHSDLDLAVSGTADFVVFLRHFGASAGITIFWDPMKVPAIDELVERIGSALRLLGGGLSCAPSDLIVNEGLAARAVDQNGWISVVPAVDALSPLPLSVGAGL